MTNSNPVTSLPTLAVHVGIVDHGPSDHGQGSASCPHCGSDGRYVHEAITTDGDTVRAMSGCIKLFPTSRTFEQTKRAAENARKAREQGRNVSSWDRAILDSVADFLAGRIGHDELRREVDSQSQRKAAWARKRYSGRR